MTQERFIAATPKEAYAQAVEKYGKESLQIISAKQLRSDEGKVYAEMIVGIPDKIETIQHENQSDMIAEQAELERLQKEIKAMKELLEQMRAEVAEVSLQRGVPAKVKAQFIEKGIAQEWLDEVLKALIGTPIIEDSALLVPYLLEEIDENLKIKEESLDTPKLMMLVGPTGVGKTTTVAKLAARYAYLLERPYKVALINLDTYKVGATEQLAYYADIMQIEHFRIDTPEAFIKQVEVLNRERYDIILVDTAGMSPYDTQKFVNTVRFIQSQTTREMEVHLVLSATVKYEDMEDIYKNFSFLSPNGLIISKFDETKHLGALLNFMLAYDIPMSYFSIGQEVPDDLLVATKEYLLEHFIGDVKDETK